MPLALSDNLTVSLAIFQLVFSFVVSLTLWRLTAWQRRYEGLEDRLHDATTRLIDERFRAMTHEVNSHVQKFLLTVEEMKQRIQSGDGELRGLSDRDQKLELLLSARLDHLKDYIRDTAATRKDLEKHESSVERKLAQVELRLGDLTSTVAVLTERVKE
jgi:chromosome segregation ATPase